MQQQPTTDLIEFPSDPSRDLLTPILREGAQKMLATAKRWRRLDGHQLIVDVIRGVQFIDGIKKVAA